MDKRREEKQATADAPTNLLGQLLFREMFFAAQAALGHTFSQTFGNKIAHFIPWRLQSTHSKSPDGKVIRDSTYAVDSEEAETWFRRWREGRTGFPWIDALMRQLKQEGWIHHLGRHSVACFLTRGGCYVSWERGVDVFQEWLIDRMSLESARCCQPD
jgi:cryptochrome